MSDEIKLFNEDRKQRYIDKKESEIKTCPGYLENLFRKVAPFEEKKGKDLCEWTLNEILDYYKFVDIYSIDSLTVMNSNYSLYTNWCLTETLVPDGQNHFQEVTTDMMRGCLNSDLINKSIITREELELNVSSLVNYTDKFIFYAIFEGIYGDYFKELLNARLSDIEKDKIHLCTGRTIQISPALRGIAEFAASEDVYTAERRGEKVVIKYIEDPGDLLFKTTKTGSEKSAVTQKSRVQRIARRYVKCVEQMGLPPQLTTKRLMVSGKLDYIKQIMKREGISFEEAVDKFRDDIDYKYPVDKIAKAPSNFIKKYEMFIK